MRDANACWFCGKPGSASAAGSVLCPACRAEYDEYLCAECGQNVCIIKTEATPFGDVCSGCHMRACAALLPLSLLEQILTEVRAERVIPAMKIARETLNWPMRDAIYLVEEIKRQGQRIAPSNVPDSKQNPL